MYLLFLLCTTNIMFSFFHLFQLQPADLKALFNRLPWPTRNGHLMTRKQSQISSLVVSSRHNICFYLLLCFHVCAHAQEGWNAKYCNFFIYIHYTIFTCDIWQHKSIPFNSGIKFQECLSRLSPILNESKMCVLHKMFVWNLKAIWCEKQASKCSVVCVARF